MKGWRFSWELGRRRPGWTHNADGEGNLDGYVYYIAEKKQWMARAKDRETMKPITASFDTAHEAMGFVQIMVGVQP